MAGPIPANLRCSSDDLVTLPDVAHRMSCLAADPRADGEAIGRLATWDLALTARLLTQANNPRWGQSGLVESVPRAVAILDKSMLCKVVQGLSTATHFDGIAADLADMETFWLTSAHVAVAAREIATRGGQGRPESVFTAGLLLDVGQLVMFQRVPGEMRVALERARPAYDHASVGAALMAAWRLPGSLRACTAWHHHPDRAMNFQAEVAIVNAANSLAILAIRGSKDFRDAPAVARGTWDRCGLTPDEGLVAVAGVHRQAEEARRLFAA